MNVSLVNVGKCFFEIPSADDDRSRRANPVPKHVIQSDGHYWRKILVEGGMGVWGGRGRSRSTVDMPLFLLTFPPVVARRRERQHRSARPPSSSHRGSGLKSRGRLTRFSVLTADHWLKVPNRHPTRVLYHAISILQRH